MDLSKIIKLLALTQSSNDNEALSAIRKANALLKENNKTWESLFKSNQVDPAWEDLFRQRQDYKPKQDYRSVDLWNKISFLKDNTSKLSVFDAMFVSSITPETTLTKANIRKIENLYFKLKDLKI